MTEFLNAFLELIVWFLETVAWDSLTAIPLVFAALSLLVLGFRRAVGLR